MSICTAAFKLQHLSLILYCYTNNICNMLTTYVICLCHNAPKFLIPQCRVETVGTLSLSVVTLWYCVVNIG